MKKYVLNIPGLTLYLIFGSVLLSVLRILLSVYDIAEANSVLSSVIKHVSGALLLGGIIFRLYETKRLGSFRSFMIRLAVGMAIVITILVIKLLYNPSFLMNIF